MKIWKEITWVGCPACGFAVEVYSTAESELVWDTDDVRCLNEECDWEGSVSVGEVQDGNADAWLSDGNVMDLCDHNKLECELCVKSSEEALVDNSKTG